jgi:hypothetical protein
MSQKWSFKNVSRKDDVLGAGTGISGSGAECKRSQGSIWSFMR